RTLAFRQRNSYPFLSDPCRSARVMRKLILTGVNGSGSDMARGGPSPHGMTQTYQAGRSVAELGAKQPHEVLLMLGGILAILLSVAIYGFQLMIQGIPQTPLVPFATPFRSNLVLGGALWASSAMTRKNLMNGAIVAVVISII